MTTDLITSISEQTEHSVIDTVIALILIESNSLKVWEQNKQNELREMVSTLPQAMSSNNENKETIISDVLTKVPTLFGIMTTV